MIFNFLNSGFRVMGRFFARSYNKNLTRKALELIKSFSSSANNVDFDMNRNGEIWLLKKVSSIKMNVILDVGANKGDYINSVLGYFPNSEIHAFEVLPSNFNSLNTLKAFKNVILNDFGLSDHDGELSIWYNSQTICNSMATSHPNLNIDSHEAYYNITELCKVKSGLNYVTERNIRYIDMLKIDVEGHELKVLKGFGHFIRKVRIIQFEFGIFNIVSHDLLADFFDLLEKNDFMVGRLFPKGIFFFKYSFSRESFDGGNYIAINKNDNELINLLSFEK